MWPQTQARSVTNLVALVAVGREGALRAVEALGGVHGTRAGALGSGVLPLTARLAL
jgi:hypothetical protein